MSDEGEWAAATDRAEQMLSEVTADFPDYKYRHAAVFSQFCKSYKLLLWIIASCTGSLMLLPLPTVCCFFSPRYNYIEGTKLFIAYLNEVSQINTTSV